MVVLDKTVVPNETFYKTIVKAFYDKAREDYSRYINAFAVFDDFESWCKRKYCKAIEGEQT